MAATAGMSSAAPSSQFAALLRRSKFSSYDPRIGQVYTSFGGDAHRGNWGLKRPLPLRRRAAHISISAVDTKEQQTVWKRAGSATRFLKIWDEVGIHPTVASPGSWRTRLGPTQDIAGWFTDSEFAKKEVGAEAWRQESMKSSNYGPQSSAWLNDEAMSDKQFEVYLSRLRRLRPAFREYLKGLSPEVTSQFHSLWEASGRANASYLQKKFLARLAWDFYNAPDSRAIEQQPAPSAGLSYTKVSELQSMLYTKPRKGRVFEKSWSGQEGLAGYAGLNSLIPAEHMNKDQEVIKWESLAKEGTHKPEEGAVELRFLRAKLVHAPTVVGSRPQGLSGMKMATHVMKTPSVRARANPHKPGSREYVGFTPSISRLQQASIFRYLENNVDQPVANAKNSKATLDMLGGLIDKKSTPSS